MKLSISLYSFAREYFDRKYTLEQCIACLLYTSAWYLVKGRIREIIIEADGSRIEEECKAGDAGYINPGDAHQEINLSIEENAEMIMCFANPENKKCNCFDDLGTEAAVKPE